MSGTTLTIDYALAYLSGANPADADSIRLSLGDSLPSNDWRWGMLSQSALAALDGTLPKIAQAMTQNRSSLIAHSSTEEYRWALQNLEVARQLVRCERVTTPKSFEDMKYSGPVIGCRDGAMAENVRWVVENEGAKGRVLVFAHTVTLQVLLPRREDGNVERNVDSQSCAHLRLPLGYVLHVLLD
jgi:erythromycin esterase